MEITFSKYQGTGNDFVLIDDRSNVFDTNNQNLISFLCDRRFGIGADGLMLLRNTQGYDFEMVYFNADGKTSSMCGNGGRCISAFAKTLGIVNNTVNFLAIDGGHEASIINQDGNSQTVKLKMNDVSGIEDLGGSFFLDTGSPHVVKVVEDLKNLNILEFGRSIRYNDRFAAEGTNVNAIEQVNGGLFVRTYERGVEDETYSCGTGVTAAAVIASRVMQNDTGVCNIKTLGGDVKVYFKDNDDGSYKDIWLEGPATFVYSGTINV